MDGSVAGPTPFRGHGGVRAGRAHKCWAPRNFIRRSTRAMTDHPSLDRILDRLLDPTGAGGQARDLAAHLASCEQCREADRWARQLVLAVAEGPPVAAPEALIDRALGIPEAEPRVRPATARWSIAWLVQDAFARPALAGVRGGATTRRMLYELDGGHVDIEIAPSPEDGESVRLTGQLLLDDAPPPEDVVALLWRDRSVVARASGDATGMFLLPSVPAGTYQLDLLSLASGRAVRVGSMKVETDES